MQNDNIDYEKIDLAEYYVAFLDIIGYKNFILNKSFDEELEFLKKINNAFYESIEIVQNERTYQNELRELKYKTFSDNIVLAIPKAMTSTASFLCFVKLLRTLCNIMITKYELFSKRQYFFWLSVS